MTTTAMPKSIQGTPFRWFTRPMSVCRVEGRTFKAGGKVAVLRCPVPGWSYVQVYGPDDEDWWDQVPSDQSLRAAIRKPARNGEDLIGYALPLANQPSELQAYIKGLSPRQMPLAEATEHPWAEAFEAAVERRKPKDTLTERRPRGTKDEELMQLLERIAKAKSARVCDVVNQLLWDAVNRRLQGQ